MASDKVTKTEITKATIASELHAENKKSSLVFVLISIIYVVFIGIVFSAVYFFGLKNYEMGAIGYIIFFVCVFICLLPPLIFILSVIGQKNSDFYVITDQVVYKEEKTVWKIRGPIVQKVVHFYRCGEVKMNSDWYQMTDENDVFYMVVRDRASKTALKYYPAKLYEYKE